MTTPERIPILMDYDHGRVVGYLTGDVVRFKPGTVTERNMLPAAWQTTEVDVVDGKAYIREARIRALSIDGREQP